MTPDLIDTLRVMYKAYYHPSIDSLPDGWYTLIKDFLSEMDGIGDLTDSVSVRFERGPDGLRSFVFPEMSRWHPEQMNTLRVAQRTAYGLSQQTCEICGQPGLPHDGSVVCIDHKDAGARKAGREEALYAEVCSLFPQAYGSAINLSVPDHLWQLLSSTLRSILKVAERYDIIGKALITRIEMDGEALFIRVRYVDLTYVFLGAQMEINELISDLEMLSDEATRKHNLGGSDAS